VYSARDSGGNQHVNATPKWYLPVTVLALLWNMAGCAAYLMDVMRTPEDIAKMSAALQALYAARPAWAVGATAIAVWAGVAGCVGLILRKRWATPFLIASLVGVVLQDLYLFALNGGEVARAVTGAFVMQGIVLLIAISLVVLARKATARGWLT
jgi:hypothetical protein